MGNGKNGELEEGLFHYMIIVFRKIVHKVRKEDIIKVNNNISNVREYYKLYINQFLGIGSKVNRKIMLGEK